MFWDLSLDFCWNEGKIFHASGIKDRVSLSTAHLKFARHHLCWKVVLLQNLAWLESSVNFLWVWVTVSDLKIILMYLFTFSCFWRSSARSHLIEHESLFNPNTLTHCLLANTPYSSHCFKETYERRWLNFCCCWFWLLTIQHGIAPHLFLKYPGKWLTENHSGLSFSGGRSGNRRRCFAATQFRAFLWITHWTLLSL